MNNEAASMAIRRMLQESKAAYRDRESRIAVQYGKKWNDWPQDDREELCLLMGRAEALEEALIEIE